MLKDGVKVRRGIQYVDISLFGECDSSSCHSLAFDSNTSSLPEEATPHVNQYVRTGFINFRSLLLIVQSYVCCSHAQAVLEMTDLMHYLPPELLVVLKILYCIH
jgi:hypothetical protein